MKTFKQILLVLTCIMSNLELKAQNDFMTFWDLSLDVGSGSTEISFFTDVSVGGAIYGWQNINGPENGGGVIPEGNGAFVIGGLPGNAEIKLVILHNNLNRFYINNGTDKNRLVDVGHWGSTQWTSMEDMFYGCSNLNVSATSIPNLNTVSSMKNMFRGCSTLTGPNNINSWNTSNITNLSAAFLGATSFNQPLNNWITSNVTHMTSIFKGAHSFNQPIGNWNVSNVIFANDLFESAYAFNQPLNNWNTSSFWAVHSMFRNTTSFNQDLSNWDLSNGNTLFGMFQDATAFNQDLSNWNVANASNMSNMFSGATSFNQNLGSWILNPNVNMTGMLNNCGMDCDNYSQTLTGWRQNNPGIVNRTLGAQNLSYHIAAFNARNQLINDQNWTIQNDYIGGCGEFITLWDLSLPGNLPNLIEFYAAVGPSGARYYWETVPANSSGTGLLSAGGMSRAIGLFPAGEVIRFMIEPEPLDIFYMNNSYHKNRLLDVEQWGTAQWTSMANMFYGCTNLNISATDIPDLSGVMNMSSAFRDCSSLTGPNNISAWNTAAVTNMFTLFRNASSFNQPLNNWNTSNVSVMTGMFFGASSFNQPIGSWNTANVSSMTQMFAGASSFNQNIGIWNTANVNSMSGMFDGASAFNQPIGSWSTANVVNMRGMFLQASSFNQNIDSWNTSNVTDMSLIFAEAINFNSALSNWNTSNVIDMSDMFYFATEFNQPLNNWNTSNVSQMVAMFYGASSFNENIGGWNTSNVNDMSLMFKYASSFNQPIGGWNTANVTNFYETFMGAIEFDQNISNWNTANVTHFSYMFWGASSFNQNISSWNTASAVSMFSMFLEASSFNQYLGNWTLHPNVEMHNMFSLSGMDCAYYSATLKDWLQNNPGVVNRTLGAQGLNYNQSAVAARNALINNQNWAITGDNLGNCGQFITVWDMSNPGPNPNQIRFYATVAMGDNPAGFVEYYWETIPAGTSGSGQLNPGTSLRTIPGFPAGETIKLYLSNRGTNKLLRFYFDSQGDRQRIVDVESWGNTTWTNMLGAFYGCSNLTVSATDLPDLNQVTSMENMFRNCSSLNGPANINAWNTSNVTNFTNTFHGATAFNQPLGNWNVANATSLFGMFQGATAFNQPIEGWNTANVTLLSNLFFNATTFNQPIGNWNTSNASHMEDMFNNATNFNHPIDSWDVSQVASMYQMFRNASNFNQPLNSWNVSSIVFMNNMFYDATSFNQELSNWNVSNVSTMHSMFRNASSFNKSLGAWEFLPTVNMLNMLLSCGMDCNSYSQTLVGWQQNNPNVHNKSFGTHGRQYGAAAVAARNHLITNQNWNMAGDALVNSNAYLIPSGQNVTSAGVDFCNVIFSHPNNQSQKIASIDPNGNAIDLQSATVTVRNAFLDVLPNDVTTETSGNSGYYEINDGINSFRLSRRLVTVEAPGNFNNNGGVLLRVYYHPEDLQGIFSDAMPFGTIGNFGWCKIDGNDPNVILQNMNATAPNIAGAIDISPTYGIENGVHYAEFLVENFSTFAVYAQTQNAPLPVTLNTFEASCRGDYIHLNWETASELNASHYSLQSSRDGFVWNEITKIDAAGTTNQTSNYNHAMSNTGNVTYFRLVQVDNDGEQEIFGPISSNCTLENNLMTVYPNPATENFTVLIQTAEVFENAHIELVDLSGRVILSQKTNLNPGSTMLNFDVKSIQPGAYIIRLKGEQDKFTPIRVVKL